MVWGTDLWTSLEDLDICDCRRDPGLLGPAPVLFDACGVLFNICLPVYGGRVVGVTTESFVQY